MIRTVKFSVTQLVCSKASLHRLKTGVRGATIVCGSIALVAVLLTQNISVLQKSPRLSPANSATDCGRDAALCPELSAGHGVAHEMTHALQAFGYVEFDWDNQAGGIPGFGPLRESDARMLADATK